jgi:hypothetical protein
MIKEFFIRKKKKSLLEIFFLSKKLCILIIKIKFFIKVFKYNLFNFIYIYLDKRMFMNF